MTRDKHNKTRNVGMTQQWGAGATIVAVKNNKYHVFWVCICSLIYPTCNGHAPYCHLRPALLYNIFSHMPFLRYINCFRCHLFICGNKMSTRCNRRYLLQILLLAQHVSGTIMPIIRSSRVLYRWSLPVVFGALFSSCRYGVELRVLCPVCGLLLSAY